MFTLIQRHLLLLSLSRTQGLVVKAFQASVSSTFQQIHRSPETLKPKPEPLNPKPLETLDIPNPQKPRSPEALKA